MSKRNFMKKMIFFAVLFFSLCLNRSASSNEIAEIYKQIDKITAENDIGKAIILLNTLDNKEICNFNGTLGPVTNFSLQLTIIQVLAHYKLINNVRQDSDMWSNLLSVKPENTKEILNLLNSTNPARRWLGLNKITQVEFSKIDQSIIEKLTSITQNDEYVIISRIPINQREGYPPLPGNTKNDFIAPLREKAHEILVKFGEEIPKDETNLYERGILNLKIYYSGNRKEVLYAIYRLAKDSKARLEITKQLSKADLNEKKMMQEFMWALENNINFNEITEKNHN